MHSSSQRNKPRYNEAICFSHCGLRADGMDGQVAANSQVEAKERLLENSFLRPFLAGALICFVIGVLHNFVIVGWVAKTGWQGWPVAVAFVLLILQCFFISFFTGRQLVANRKLVWAWIFFYLWCLLMINLALGHVYIESARASHWQLSLVFAFFQAQLGLMIIWGVLGSYDWRKRFPLFAIGLWLFGYPLWSMDFSRWVLRGWLTLLICYIVAVFSTALILRWLRFRITALQFETDPDKANIPQGQFSVFNLFVWTTIAATAVGVGRFVPWELVWESVWATEIRFGILVSILLTIIAVSTCWAALGAAKGNKYLAIFYRTVVLFVLFAAISFGLYSCEFLSTGRNGWGWRGGSFIGGWGVNLKTQGQQVFMIWCAWTVLNGFFLFGLLQVLGAAGCRLVRKPRRAVDA